MSFSSRLHVIGDLRLLRIYYFTLKFSSVSNDNDDDDDDDDENNDNRIEICRPTLNVVKKVEL